MNFWQDRSPRWALLDEDTGELIGQDGRAFVYETRDDAREVGKLFRTPSPRVVKVKTKYERVRQKDSESTGQ